MSAKDTFHDAVRNGLEKDGWTITSDPLRFDYGDVTFQVDLGAERLLVADRGNEKIAVEVKSFLRPSATTDFYAALGQFISYRLALQQVEPDRLLYLAVPNDAFNSFFQTEFAKVVVDQYAVLLVVYEPIEEVIVKWIS